MSLQAEFTHGATLSLLSREAGLPRLQDLHTVPRFEKVLCQCKSVKTLHALQILKQRLPSLYQAFDCYVLQQAAGIRPWQ